MVKRKQCMYKRDIWIIDEKRTGWCIKQWEGSMLKSQQQMGSMHNNWWERQLLAGEDHGNMRTHER